MKQEDWTGQMRRRLADRETPAPDDLWEKIEMRLDATAPKPVLKPRYTIRRIAMWSASAADTAKRTVVGYFGLDGTRLQTPRKGVNIVKYADGSSKKVVVM